MKSIVACLVFLAVSVFAVPCPTYNYKCAANNGACSFNLDATTNVYSIVQCSNNQICNNQTAGTCYSRIAVGQSCSGNNNNCVAGAYCDGTTCTAIQYGIANGQPCSPGTKWCTNDNVCDALTRNCTALATSGQDCSTKGCAIGLTCGSGRVCVNRFSVSSGGSCLPVGNIGDECDSGLICDSSDSKCKSPISNPSGASCTPGSNPCTATLETCTQSQCSGENVYTYSCTARPAKFNTCQKNAAKALDTCKNNNKNCIGDEASCKSCLSKLCDQSDCVSTTTLCDNNGFCSGAASIAASAVLLIAALFVAM